MSQPKEISLVVDMRYCYDRIKLMELPDGISLDTVLNTACDVVQLARYNTCEDLAKSTVSNLLQMGIEPHAGRFAGLLQWIVNYAEELVVLGLGHFHQNDFLAQIGTPLYTVVDKGIVSIRLLRYETTNP